MWEYPGVLITELWISIATWISELRKVWISNHEGGIKTSTDIQILLNNQLQVKLLPNADR